MSPDQTLTGGGLMSPDQTLTGGGLMSPDQTLTGGGLMSPDQTKLADDFQSVHADWRDAGAMVAGHRKLLVE